MSSTPENRILVILLATVGFVLLKDSDGPKTQGKVRAREFVLVNDSGVDCGRWAVQDGQVSFELWGEEHQNSLRLVIRKAGGAQIAIGQRDETGFLARAAVEVRSPAELLEEHGFDAATFADDFDPYKGIPYASWIKLVDPDTNAFAGIHMDPFGNPSISMHSSQPDLSREITLTE